jgi:hypothetical protein
MTQGTKKKKDEAASKSETKAGLMSKDSDGKKSGKSTKSEADLENLPKASKSETGKSGGNEGLH